MYFKLLTLKQDEILWIDFDFFAIWTWTSVLKRDETFSKYQFQ